MDSSILKALADDTRLAIIERLADGERCICDLASSLGASDALVSHHVKRLREAGLVRTRRLGVWLHCSLEPDALDAVTAELTELSRRARVAVEADVACCTPQGEQKVAPAREEVSR